MPAEAQLESPQLKACTRCCIGRTAYVPNCRTCQFGGGLIGQDGRVDWAFYGQFRKWVREKVARDPSELVRYAHSSLSEAGILVSEPAVSERVGYLLFAAGFSPNPYDGTGLLYFVEAADARAYAEVMGYQDYHLLNDAAS